MTRPSFLSRPLLLTLFTAWTLVSGLRFDASEADWNLNQERLAETPLEYNGTRAKDLRDYTQPPKNWRVPFYSLFLDRFVNGDPENDDKNGTVYETDMMSTQLRFGGDLDGLLDTLDYIEGMGIKVHRLARWNREMSVLTRDRPSTSQGLRSSTFHGAPIRTRYVDIHTLSPLVVLTDGV
jgi:alpha-1,3-glucan synthase